MVVSQELGYLEKHNFLNKLMKKNKVNYLRVNIFPDGGISRIRVFGKV